jgi:hypothetical protein
VSMRGISCNLCLAWLIMILGSFLGAHPRTKPTHFQFGISVCPTEELVYMYV